MTKLSRQGIKEAEDYAERFGNYFGGFPPFNISAFLQNEKTLDVLVDVYETEKEVVAICDLPGVAKKEDILIDILDNKHLKIRVSRGHIAEFEGKRVIQKERVIGQVDRTITLPADVDLKTTEAGYKNGVLTITMPKKVIGLEQKIDIKFED